jgi:hypothetical protein
LISSNIVRRIGKAAIGGNAGDWRHSTRESSIASRSSIHEPSLQAGGCPASTLLFRRFGEQSAIRYGYYVTRQA